MNRDRALFERAHHFAAGECEIRIYEWDKATISIGLSQKKDTFNADLLAKDEVSLVKRITGGRAVWHHREITYAVAAPLPSLAFGSDLYSSYRKISGILMFFLKKLSIEASLVRKKGYFRKSLSSPVCFQRVGLYEIEVGGKKLIGSAQKRGKRAFLQHGSIPVFDYQNEIKKYLPSREKGEDNSTRLADWCSFPDMGYLKSLFADCFRRELSRCVEKME